MMTIPTSALFKSVDTHQLLNIWSDLQEREANYREYREGVEHELTQRMNADGATSIAHETLTCDLKAPSPTYDRGKLHAIAEMVPPDESAKGFTPAHWGEPVWEEDQYNLVKIKPLVKYGAAIAQVIETATIPGAPRLVIKRKEAL